jgi:glycosyltransferase involved in cell wall biosynthesis
LKKKQELKHTELKADDVPIVSISCLTFQHSKYIKQCLDGFLMQQTTFPVEVLIHDDASTDGTEEIIREYEAKYPDIIKSLYEKENQWVKGRRGSAVFNFPRAKGKYIAMCEGDDYWTDPLKLQKQVDFLEGNPGYEMCFTNCRTVSAVNETLNKSFVNYKNNSFTKDDLLFVAPTLTRVFRNQNLAGFNLTEILGLDAILLIFQLHRGKAWFINEVTASYRKHSGGIWSLANELSKAKYYFDIRLNAFEIIDESLVLKFNRLTIIALLNIKILSLNDYSVCKQKFLTNFKNQSRQTFIYKSKVYLSLFFLKFSNKKNRDFFKKLIYKIL